MTHAGEAQAVGLTFEVLAEIAAGNTARVDLCRTITPAAGQLIAVKRLNSDIAADPSSANRFLDEVWMTSALRHPNVVGVVGWGTDNGGSYLAVELVQGVSLARLMKTVFDTREEFPERLVVFVGLSVLKGLAAAHELSSEGGEPLGLVHRDLGVGNVLIGFNGDVKVADFGLARAKNRLTQTTGSLPMRSVGHLAPEELRGDEIDHRADLYAVGVMLYELLTGRAPFQGKDELDTIRLILSSATPDPIRVRPRIDMALAATVRRCLEKNPAARFRSAREVARELDNWLYTHGHRDDNAEALGRFVRRNSMRQMRWFERVISGQKEPQAPARNDTPIGDAVVKTSTRAPQETPSSRDTETTVVDAAKKRPLPRRSRSSDAVPAPSRRRRDLYASGLPSAAGDDDDEEGEDIPTVAMKREDHPAFRQLMENRTGREPLPSTPDPPTRAREPLPSIGDNVPTRAREAPPPIPDPRATVPLDEHLARVAASPHPRRQDTLLVEQVKQRPDTLIVEPSSADVMEITDDPSTNRPLPKAPTVRPPPVPSRPPAARTAPPPAPPSRGGLRNSAPPPRPRGIDPRGGTIDIRPNAAEPRPAPVAARPKPSSEPTEPMPTHALAPEYIRHQVDRLRDAAALKAAEARRLHELATQAQREAERASNDATRAARAATLAVEAMRIAAQEGIEAASTKLEEALAVEEEGR